MKLDILVVAAHPDDVELGCGGTVAKHVAMGYKVGIVDFTRGELGTRGTPEIRLKEAAEAGKILGVSVRENLGLKDGFFQSDSESQLALISQIRKYQPTIMIANAVHDRHIDHGKGASLAYDASFLSGLVKIQTEDENGNQQKPWRPQVMYHYIQSNFLKPDFVVDITGHWEKKLDAIRAFKSQFFDPENNEPQTYISNPAFLKMVESRAQELGHSIGVGYGEGFTVRREPGVKSLFDLI
jgi:bacillithiol biosynthesis deacetylase BshB1